MGLLTKREDWAHKLKDLFLNDHEMQYVSTLFVDVALAGRTVAVTVFVSGRGVMVGCMRVLNDHEMEYVSMLSIHV